MKKTKSLSTTFSRIALAIAGVCTLGSGAVFAQTTIYSDTFARAGNLLGSAPEIRPGSETWVAAASDRTTDGSVLNFANDRGNAFLPFTPGVGIYELSVRVFPPAGSTATNWHAVGFMQPSANMAAAV